MSKYRDGFKEEIGAFDLDAAEMLERSTSKVLDAAKVGWAQPSILTLEEVQELCKALVMLEAKTGMVTKAAA